MRALFLQCLLTVALLCAPAGARIGELEAQQDPPSAGGYIDTGARPLKLVIATYNVRARPFLDDAASKFPAIGPLLDPFDVVALQECFTEHHLLWASVSHPAKVYDGTRTDWLRLVGSGLCTLARLPVKETIAEKFDQPEGLRFLLRSKKDGLASKGILLTRLNMGEGKTLDVYNTHLEAGSDDASNEVRRRQARQLIRMVRTKSPREHAVVIAGDLNLSAPGRKHQQLGKDHPRDLRGLSRPQIYQAITRELGLVNAANISSDPPSALIDHILYRSGTSLRLEPVAWKLDSERFRSAEGEPWSDHDPVAATFRIRP